MRPPFPRPFFCWRRPKPQTCPAGRLCELLCQQTDLGDDRIIKIDRGKILGFLGAWVRCLAQREQAVKTTQFAFDAGAEQSAAAQVVEQSFCPPHPALATQHIGRGPDCRNVVTEPHM